MELNQVMKTLERLGTEQTKKTFLRHGAPGPLFGVKIGDLKKELLKDVKKDQQLALDLFETGNSDAQYLAGLAINPKLIEKKQLIHWANYSNWSAINEFVVAGVASESPYAVELAKEWMTSDQELLEDTGWSCYGKFLSFAPDTSIDQEEVLALLKIIENTIHQAKNSVRYTMNQFVINTGCYYTPLLKEAQQVAETIGPVKVTLGSKDCKVPLASEAIEKAIRLERIGKKRKKVIC